MNSDHGLQVKVASGILTTLNGILDELAGTSMFEGYKSCSIGQYDFHVFIYGYDVLIVLLEHGPNIMLSSRCRHHVMICLSDSACMVMTLPGI